MPRVSRAQSDSNRAAITEASARLFRERGIDGVSVADLMGAAGLTHGGFYGHFASKEALAAEACTLAFKNSADRWQKRAADKGADSAKTALIAGFLSDQSRSSPGTSCPTTALACDVAREPPGAPIRAAFAEGVETLIGILGSLQHSGDRAGDRRDACADLSTMVGALLLARATAGHGISDEFLTAARVRLNAASSAGASAGSGVRGRAAAGEGSAAGGRAVSGPAPRRKSARGVKR